MALFFSEKRAFVWFLVGGLLSEEPAGCLEHSLASEEDMKRISGLVMAAVLVFSTMSAALAEGIEVQVKGHWQVSLTYMSDQTLQSPHSRGSWGDIDNYNAYQRFRTQIDFIASENLRGVLAFELGTFPWGGHGNGSMGTRAGGALDADSVNMKTRRAYLDWVVPGSDLAIRMGILPLNLPMANGIWRCSPVMSADVAGVTASYTFNDMLALTVFWARPFDTNWNDSNQHMEDEMDMFGFMLPVTGDGWNVTPHFMYSRIGGASGYAAYQQTYWPNPYFVGGTPTLTGGETDKSVNAWWAGVALNLDVFDPVSIGLDFVYGRMGKINFGQGTDFTGDNIFFDGRRGGSGWLAAARIDYKLENMTPGLYGWYTSGDSESKARDDKSGRLPVVGMDDGWGAASMGFAGGRGTNSGDCVIGVNPIGTWGIAAQIKDIHFIDDLSHLVRFAFYKGTNDHELLNTSNFSRYGGPFRWGSVGEKIYLTDKDKVYEVNVDTVWQVYENFDITLELGWMRADFGDYDNSSYKRDGTEKNSWKAQAVFGYSF